MVPLVGSLVDQGRLEAAGQELANSLSADEIPDSPALTPLLLERMRLHLARRDYGRAAEDWEEAHRRALRHFTSLNASFVPDMLLAAEAHHALGDGEAASELLSEASALAERWGAEGFIGQVRHQAARLGRRPDAPERLREAVAHLERSPARLELARALVSLGEALRRAGHRAESREPLRQGYELARQCGAGALAEAARTELRASGVRLQREALSGAESLTASERRIAEMAAGGTSNPEIAQALFLTVKTVESHLTHAYRKLDIAGRSQLAEALADKP
jgi:DNA-binding CsgD family transcriptional regulator